MAVIALGTIATLGYGGYEVFGGCLTVGGVVAFYSYLARLFDPLNAAVEIYSRFNRLSASIRRIVEVIEKTPTVSESPSAVHLPSTSRGYVELLGVSFSYGKGTPVLDGLGLKVEAGEKVALVGVGGRGKGT